MVRVIEAIRKNSLLKTGLQQRDEEMRQALDFLPRVLLGLVSDYVETESCLRPLALSPFGDVRSFSVNTPIRYAICSAFSETGMSGESFRKAILKTHSRYLLNQVFADYLELHRATNILDAIRSGNKQARQTRIQHHTAVVNYLPDARCQEIVQIKKAQLRKLQQTKDPDQACLDNIDRLNIDLQLFFNCINKADPALKACQKDIDLRNNALCKINLDIDAAIEKRDFSNAHQGIMQAFELLCDEGNKREAIKVAIHFIELSRHSTADNFQQIIELVEPIKALCISYPFDTDLYAELLFKIADSARVISEFSVVKNLYEQAFDVMKRDLPIRYKAKFLYRYVFLLDTIAPNTLTTLSKAINVTRRFHQAHQHQAHDRPLLSNQPGSSLTEPKQSKFKDVSTSEFLRCFSSLYRLSARIIEHQFNAFPTLPASLRAEFFARLEAVNNDMDNELGYEIHEPLKHFEVRLSAEMPEEFIRSQLVFVIANCYKKALKILFDDSYKKPLNPAYGGNQLNPENAPLCIHVMDELVNLYSLHGLQKELSELIRDSFQYIVASELPNFGHKLLRWRSLLNYMDTTQNGHWESDRKSRVKQSA